MDDENAPYPKWLTWAIYFTIVASFLLGLKSAGLL